MKKWWLILTAAAWFATPAFASELTDLLNQMQSMRASFKQIIYDNGGKAIQQSSGTMALNRPGKFRWQVTEPMPQTIIANNGRLWVYDPDLQQVVIRSLQTEAGEAPALLLSNQNATFDTNYSISNLPAEQGLKWFLLKPKQKDNMFSEVKLAFAGSQLKEMVLADQIGHITRMQFTKIEMNVNLPASLFIFKAPSGTDVIDETKK